MDALLLPIGLMTELHIFKTKNLDLQLKSRLPTENLDLALKLKQSRYQLICISNHW